MSPTPDDTGSQGSSEPAELPFDELPTVRGTVRPSLWLLLVPVLLYGSAPLVANSIEPRIFGVPFLLAWIIAATVISPIVIWIVARLDPAYRTGAVEPLPVDDLPDAPTARTPAEGGSR